MLKATCPERVLVVGAGVAGLSAAIVLRKLGANVSLIDTFPKSDREKDIGITITGPTLRAINEFGLLEEVIKSGYIGGGTRVCSIDGTMIAELPGPMPIAEGIPGGGSIILSVLQNGLYKQAVKLGIDIDIGVAVNALHQGEECVQIELDNGRSENYDLLIGADGLHSRIRTLAFPEVPPPKFSGQYSWRLLMPKLPQLDQRLVYFGGDIKIGLSPVSQTEMYLFMLQKKENLDCDKRGYCSILRELLSDYGGLLASVRENLDRISSVVVRPLEVLPHLNRWYEGRVILIGDAVHPVTHQLFSGVCLALEDSIVLSQELVSKDSISLALAGFMSRRLHRCKRVMENSLEIIRRENEGAPVGLVATLVDQSLSLLNDPI